MWLHAVPRCRGVSRPACVVFLLCTPDGVSENSRWLSDSATTGNWPPSKRIRIRRDECGSRSCGVALGQKERPASVFSGGFRDSACRCGRPRRLANYFTPVWCVFLNHEWARIDTNIGVSVWTGRLAPFRFYGASMSSARRCTVGAGPLFLRRRNAGVFDQCVGSIGTKVVRFRSKAFSAASRARR